MTKSQQHIALYVRVSTRKQETRSQEPDLLKWSNAFADGVEVRRYCDKASGKTMDRPGWRKLEAAIDCGEVCKVVVWRLDRLGRTASGLVSLFEKLAVLNIGLVSIKESLDLSTPAGRLLANMLASVAAFENEIRSERIRAGQAAARRAGKKWGGSRKGRKIKLTAERVRVICRLKREGESVAGIARSMGISRPTVYAALASNNGRV